ncbi:MAG: hypothetical protein NW220_04260 [Leptolyngbyaceae cyanobacterium bins.349]|nr:hypothetical protein [Leptolyngbyaceae cyanobacterium bins.349]
MQTNELKFLLKLLGYADHRAPITKLAISEKMPSSKRDRVCVSLGERELIGYSRDVKRFRISTAGKALLKQESEELPLAERHLLILKACAANSITPGQIKKIPASESQPLIQELEVKGLVEAEKAQIKEVWLTERGSEYLRDECNPSGNTTISLNLLGNYLNFLRKATRGAAVTEQQPASATIPQEKPTDEKILQIIRDLDQELRTDNYLPIFHLRKKLQPPFSRDELDQALYRLQKQDKLELSSLVGASQYESEAIQAGIPQDSGGPLFFLIVNE